MTTTRSRLRQDNESRAKENTLLITKQTWSLERSILFPPRSQLNFINDIY